MSKQTAVEWLFQELWNRPKDRIVWHSILEKALQREKEQIIDAHNHGFTEGTCFGASPISYKFVESEKYYNETFKTKEK